MTEIVNKDDYLNALDEEVQENSNWIKIQLDETKRLRFVLTRKPEYKEDSYLGQPTGVWKTFYSVIDINSSNQKEKTFKANTASTKLINKALRISKDLVLDITHKGTGSDTVYRPKVVNPRETERKIDED